MSDVPAWIEAIGTVGTLSTGLILFVIAMSDRRREYAKSVAVWTDFGKIDKDSIRPMTVKGLGLGLIIGPMSNMQQTIELSASPGLSDSVGFRLNLKNNGLQPVYGCELRVNMDRNQLPPGTYPIVFEELDLKLGIIAPGTEISHSLLSMDTPDSLTNLSESLTKALTFRLRFTDAAGRCWARTESGQLKRLRMNRAAQSRYMPLMNHGPTR